MRTVAAAALAVVLAGTTAGCGSGPEPGSGATPPATSTDAATATSARSPATAAGKTSGGPDDSVVTTGDVESAAVEDEAGAAKTEPEPVTPEVPTSLSLAGVGSWELWAAGTTAEGIINPPAGTVQWYDASPRPGAAGIAVIAGHVTTAGAPDVFADLARAEVGGEVVVRDAAGVEREFEITAVRSADKDEIMVDPAVWGPSEVPRLAIVTCDAASPVEAGGHLAANLVVEAVATGG